MQRTLGVSGFAVSFVSLQLTLAMSAAGTEYAFHKVVDSTTIPFDFARPAAINNSGTVVFGTGGWLYAAPPGQAPQIIPDPTGELTNSSSAAINDDGVIAFQGFRAAGNRGIYAYFPAPGADYRNGHRVTLVTTGTQFNSLIGTPTLNGTTVVFEATTPPLSHGHLYAASLVDPNQPIATYTREDAGFIGVYDKSVINASGDVAFTSEKLGLLGVYRRKASGEIIPLLEDTKQELALTNPSINAAGDVIYAYHHWKDDADSAYLHRADKPTAELVASPGRFDGILAVALNDQGLTVLRAVTPDSKTGIFTGPDPVADKVIQRGDPLFGKAVSSIEFASNGLNDKGQIAFGYAYSGGARGIAIATPLPTNYPDANLDAIVDRNDFDALYANFGKGGGRREGDFNSDGMVDFLDFQLLEIHFGQRLIGDSFPIASTDAEALAEFRAHHVPEPVLWWITIVLLSGLGRRRQRI